MGTLQNSLSEFNNLERKASSEKKFIEKQLEKYCNAERCVSAEELETSDIGKQWNKQITNENILINQEDLNIIFHSGHNPYLMVI